MKKIAFHLLVFLTCGAVYALPVGNPSEASFLCDGVFWDGNCCIDFCDYWCNPCVSWCDVLSLRVGYYGDFVFNRHMELDNNGDADIEDTEIYTNAGYLVLNFFDRLDIFGTLGATNIFIETNASAFRGTDGARLEIETETDFSWSVGARLTIVECGCSAFGVEGQYFETCPDVNRVTLSATTSVYPDENVKAKYCEWQIGLGFAYRINMLVPYAAIKWSRSKLDFDNSILTAPSATLFNLESKKCIGYAIGVSLIDCEKAAVTVEGRWADERALYVNGQLRF